MIALEQRRTNFHQGLNKFAAFFCVHTLTQRCETHGTRRGRELRHGVILPSSLPAAEEKRYSEEVLNGGSHNIPLH